MNLIVCVCVCVCVCVFTHTYIYESKYYDQHHMRKMTPNVPLMIDVRESDVY